MSKKKMTFKEYVESVENGEPLDKVRIKMFSAVDKLMKSLEESSNEMLSDAMLKLFEIKEQPEQVKELIEDALKLYEKSLKPMKHWIRYGLKQEISWEELWIKK